MKKKRMGWEGMYCPIKKILRIMRLAVFLLLASFVQLTANNSYAQKTKLSVDLQDASIESVLLTIENQSAYKFIYNKEKVDVESRVSIQQKEKSINEILDILLVENGISYTFYGNQVILTKDQDGNATQQNKTISGKVTDASGAPLPGVTVVVKSTVQGTITDVDGSFTLPNVPGDGTLVFSFVGMKTQEVGIAGKTTIKVVMEDDAIGLDEVVAIGYGMMKKSNLTGSTVNVTSEKIEAVNAVDAFGALQSQAAGVNITSNSGQPGESYKVTIRGMGTIGNSEPLYVIDGVPGGSITALSPNDIESIDILKDAASSAIYGARAANGIILVTTKKGKSGSIQVSYDGYYGIQNANTNGVTPLNAKQYMEVINKAYEIQGTEGYNFAGLIPKQFQQIQNGTWNGTNWLKESMVKNAPITNHSVSMTGGSDISRFALGFTYFKQDGTIGYPANPNYSRYTIRMNSDYSVWKKNGRDLIKFGENINFSLSDKSGIAIGDNYDNSIRDLLISSPLLPAYNEAGGLYEYADMQEDEWDFNQDFKNPLAAVKYDHANNYTKSHRLQTNFFLEINPIKELKFKSSAGWQYFQSDYRRYVPAYVLSANSSNSTDDVTQTQSYSTKWSWENTLNFVKSIGDNNLDILLGQSIEKWGYGNDISAKNSNSLFPGSFDHAYISNTQGLDAANTDISGSPETPGALSSFFGRINYNYQEKYLMSAVIRTDGSSNFKKGNRWGYFPSASAGWIITNEPWMDRSDNWLTFLKLRGSWGQNGNCNITNFQYVATIAFDAPYYFNDLNNPSTGAYPDILPNEDVTWETSEQLDFGLDARFFGSRLGFSFDWYNKTTKDWLVVAPALLSYGTGAPYINGGDIRNRGYEILLSWNDRVNNDFSYGANITFSHNTNEVTRLANSEGIIHGESNVLAQNTDELYRVEVGYPIGYFWGYQVEGIIQNDKDMQDYINANCGGDVANSLQKASLQPGDCKFVDFNKDGKIDKNDKTLIGNPHPKINLGVTFNIQYKGFDLAVNGYGAFGQQIAKSYRHFSNKPDENYNTDVLTKYWSGEGSTNRYPRFSDGKNTNLSEVSSIWLEDGDYFKFSNITFGYDFKRLIKSNLASKLRLYVSAQNMITFTKYSGMDPEIGWGNDEAWASGIDVGNYPSSRAWIFGLNLTF